MNRTIVRRALLLTVFGVAISPAAVGRAAQGGAGPVVTTVMSGLDNPRGLTFAPNGALYVGEAGRGPSDQSCFANPSQPQCVCGSFGTTVACSGPTGAVSRLWRDEQQRVVEGLPSWSVATGRAEGPNGIAMLGLGDAYVTIGLEAAPRCGSDAPGAGGRVRTIGASRTRWSVALRR
jgi:hypothetical protein